MDTIIIPITDFLRKAGEYADRLPSLEKIIITRGGRPFAELKASPQEKNRKLIELIKSFNGKLFENEEVWKAVYTRRNRKKPITI